MRSFFSILLPAGTFALWTAYTHPVALGYLGILVFGLALALGAAGFSLVRQKSAERSWRSDAGYLLLLFLSAAAVTAFYWYRVWSYRDWEMAGIPVVLFAVVAFWWPGFFVAAAAWLIREFRRTPALAPYLIQLSVGILAGGCGAFLYNYADTAYYRTHDRIPFQEAMTYVSLSGGFTTLAPSRWTLENGLLTLDHYARPDTSQPPLFVLESLDGHLSYIRLLLDRKDTHKVTVQISSDGRRFLSFEASETDRKAALWDLVQLDRSMLKDGGRLDKESLDRLTWSPPGTFLNQENRMLFSRLFTYDIGEDELRISADLPEPPTAEIVDLYSVCWQTSQEILRRAVRYFPEMERFPVKLPAYSGTIHRDEVTEDFSLQNHLVPPGQMIGLIIRRGESPDPHQDFSKFFPGYPLQPFQVAIKNVHDPLEEHLAGRLFEEILISSGRCYVVQARPDGAVQIFYAPWAGSVHGPAEIPAGSVSRLGDITIRNLGWISVK